MLSCLLERSPDEPLDGDHGQVIGSVGVHGLATDRKERSLRVEQIEGVDLALAERFALWLRL